MLSLQYLFKTRSIGRLEVLKYKVKQRALDNMEARLAAFQAKLRLNVFNLLRAMSGIWDNLRILDDDTLSSELDALKNLFDKLNPTSARLKENKFRL